MTLCKHDMDLETCDLCTASRRSAGPSAGSRSGMSFALIHAPSVRADTFLHLNRQGDSWKIRHYPAADASPVVVDQAGERSGRGVVADLATLDIAAQEPYPHSSTGHGESVENSAYWHREIEELNRRHGLGSPGPAEPVA